jgi:hypothetical protein
MPGIRLRYVVTRVVVDFTQRPVLTQTVMEGAINTATDVLDARKYPVQEDEPVIFMRISTHDRVLHSGRYGIPSHRVWLCVVDSLLRSQPAGSSLSAPHQQQHRILDRNGLVQSGKPVVHFQSRMEGAAVLLLTTP